MQRSIYGEACIEQHDLCLCKRPGPVLILRKNSIMATGKYIVIFGIVIVVIGLIVWKFGNIFSWFGNLPGDIKIDNENSKFYFPVVSCIVISILLSLILWLIRKFS